MRIPSYLSNKIVALSAMAMFSVVLIHSHSIDTMTSVAPWCVFVETLLCRSLTCWAVPFFFVVSGFFFAQSKFVAREESYGTFVRTKLRTLLIPYFLWAIIGTCLGLPLILANNLILHKGLFERTFMASGEFCKSLDLLFGITSNGPVGNLALWYVRALILFFVAAPLWRFLMRFKCSLLLSFVLIFVGREQWAPFLAIHYSSLGWFLFGVCAAKFHLGFSRWPRLGVGLLGLGYVTLGLWMSWRQCTSGQCAGFCGSDIASEVEAVLGILFFWGAYEFSPFAHLERFPAWTKETFWVYCLHGSLIGYFVSGPLYVFGKFEGVAICVTLIAPILTILICLGVCALVRSRLSRLALILTGNRGVSFNKEGSK